MYHRDSHSDKGSANLIWPHIDKKRAMMKSVTAVCPCVLLISHWSHNWSKPQSFWKAFNCLHLLLKLTHYQWLMVTFLIVSSSHCWAESLRLITSIYMQIASSDQFTTVLAFEIWNKQF